MQDFNLTQEFPFEEIQLINPKQKLIAHQACVRANIRCSEAQLALHTTKTLKVLGKALKVLIIMGIITPTEIIFDSLLIIAKNYKRSRKL